MTVFEDIAKTFNMDESKVKEKYDKVLSSVKEKWGEADADKKAIRRVISQLQRAKLSGEQIFEANILGFNYPVDFNEIAIKSIKKKIDKIGEIEAKQKGLINDKGEYLYQTGFATGEVISGENYFQDILAYKVEEKQMIHLLLNSSKQTTELSFNKTLKITAKRKRNVENAFNVQKIEVTDKQISEKEISDMLFSLPVLKEDEFLAYLTSNENKEVIIESTVIDKVESQKGLVQFQIPGKLDEVLNVWVDNSELLQDIQIDELARAIISNTSYINENHTYTANSALIFVDQKIKDLYAEDVETSEETAEKAEKTDKNWK